MMPTKAVLIHDSTGGANAAHNTGTLVVADYDSLLVLVIPSGAAGASTLDFKDADFSTATSIRGLATPATAAVKSASWGPTAENAASSEYVGGLSSPVPNNVRFDIGALGVGITARLRVWGRRNFRGSVNRPLQPDGTPTLD